MKGPWLSAEKIVQDLHEELVSLPRVLTATESLTCLPVLGPADGVPARLRELLGRAWSARWQKVVNKKPRPHRPQAKQSGAPTSVQKILQAAQQKKQPAASSFG